MLIKRVIYFYFSIQIVSLDLKFSSVFYNGKKVIIVKLVKKHNQKILIS